MLTTNIKDCAHATHSDDADTLDVLLRGSRGAPAVADERQMAQATRARTLPVVPDVLVIDTCVLISSVLRPLLLRMAKADWFAPVWSPIIGDEWRRTAARLWQTPAEDIALQWGELQDDFPAADIGDVSQYKTGLQRSDPKDWHVIAAARAATAQCPRLTVAIVTRNIKDFHRAELRSLGIYLFDPDQLMTRFWSQDATRLQAHLAGLPEHAQVQGRELESLEVLLKRERLFRLNRLFQAGTGTKA